jgi:hypothetical protein
MDKARSVGESGNIPQAALTISTAVLQKRESGICTQKIIGIEFDNFMGEKGIKIAANSPTIPFPAANNSNSLFPAGFVSHAIKLILQLSV